MRMSFLHQVLIVSDAIFNASRRRFRIFGYKPAAFFSLSCKRTIVPSELCLPNSWFMMLSIDYCFFFTYVDLLKLIPLHGLSKDKTLIFLMVNLKRRRKERS